MGSGLGFGRLLGGTWGNEIGGKGQLRKTN